MVATARDEEDLFKLLRFFGVDISSAGFDVLQSRDHWRQAMWDKLQLARALRRDTDVDGNGAPDLDGRIFYSGHSLGGTMGPALLAADPQIEAAELSVPGGRVSDIIRKSDTFAILVMALTPPGTDPSEVERFFPLLQTVLERGDPANRAAATLDRDVLMTMVIDDDIMPNTTTSALARALGVEHGGPILEPVTGLTPVTLPTSGNVDGHTRVLYQYDQQWDNDTDALEPADHEHAQSNLLSVTQLQHWWLTRLQTGQAQAIDPLEALGL